MESSLKYLINRYAIMNVLNNEEALKLSILIMKVLNGYPYKDKIL